LNNDDDDDERHRQKAGLLASQPGSPRVTSTVSKVDFLRYTNFYVGECAILHRFVLGRVKWKFTLEFYVRFIVT